MNKKESAKLEKNIFTLLARNNARGSCGVP